MVKKVSKKPRSAAGSSVLPSNLANASTIYLLHHAYLGYRDLLGAATQGLGLTPGAAIVLSLVARNEGVSAAQLAKWLHIAPQSINVHIASLIAQGLILREVNAQNRRSLKLRVSPDGLEKLNGSKAAFGKTEAELLSGMNGPTREQLNSILIQLVSSIRAYQQKIAAPDEEADMIYWQ